MSEKIVRIGCASAFWGDTRAAAPQLVGSGRVDYVVFDYLAEITMSILAAMRARAPDMGYATDFVTVTMAELVREIAERGIRVVSNAGGVNPRACAAAVRRLAAEAGVALEVAVVLGDDLMDRIGEPGFEGLPERTLSLNAYLGARPIARALDQGADVIITGRCVDSALVLGPLMHEFGWADDDYDRLAAGSLAGHILECGAQATGGIHTDWRDVPGYDRIGFPIAECAADGGFVVTKPEDTGGLVTPATVGEQLLYEIGDPRAYLLPDVTCDFTAVTLEAEGEDRVRARGARGRPPTDSYKASATYADGFRSVALFSLVGLEAAAKARKVASAILERTRRMMAERGLGDYRAVEVQVLGSEDSYGPYARAKDPREVVVRIAVQHDDKRALDIFSREIAPAGTGMAPGMSGFGEGRPKVRPVIRLRSLLVSKARVPIEIETDGGRTKVEVAATGGFDPATLPPPEVPVDAPPSGPTVVVPLVKLAWGRSGDKGDDANIGIIARRPKYLPAIRRALGVEAVAAYFGHLLAGPVERYDLPGINALNFVLRRSLGGGGTASLRNDPQGKAYAQMLLDFPIEVPESWGLGD